MLLALVAHILRQSLTDFILRRRRSLGKEVSKAFVSIALFPFFVWLVLCLTLLLHAGTSRRGREG